MLSAEFESVPTGFIWVDRGNRIRKEITDAAVEEKMESISRIGLIHPPVIRRDGCLVSGETRWTALCRLGWSHTPIQWVDTLDEDALLSIELEENIKRTDLSWQDQCDALLRLHELRRREDPTWTQEQTGDLIGLDQTTVSNQLAVAQELRAGNERVVGAKEFSVAKGITVRQTERRKQDELALIGGSPQQTTAVVLETPILTADFTQWVTTYSGPPFNFIHCDFPYGINADKFNQSAADAFGGYEDSPETYFALLRALCDNKEKLLGGGGHVLFWFSMRWYSETLAELQKHFWVDPYPLVWHKSDNRGTLPDPQRGPRRIYEVAFLCSYKDRKILQPVANTFAAPTVRATEHMSEKNSEMLSHFMRMIVDEHTRMLDPTCGSGSAIRAATALGAASVLGLELNPDFAENARRAWLEANPPEGEFA
jgi:hypothetical protein